VTKTYAHPRKEKGVGIAEQARALVLQAAGTFSPDLGPILLFAVLTGLRRGELCGIQWSDIDLVGSLAYPCPTMHSSGRRRLEIEELAADPPRVESWKFRFHDLRHLSATEMVGQGMDPRTVAARLGHANPSVTLAVYAHAVEAATERPRTGSVAHSAHRS
jgi:integrase